MAKVTVDQVNIEGAAPIAVVADNPSADDRVV